VIIEVILIILIIVLLIVLALETREYRQAVRYTKSLDSLVQSYAQGFNTVAESVQGLQAHLEGLTTDQNTLEEQMLLVQALIDVHNRALHLNPELIEKIRDKGVPDASV
jgi:hypothetical protein